MIRLLTLTFLTLLLTLPTTAQDQRKVDRVLLADGSERRGHVRRTVDFDLGRGVEIRNRDEATPQHISCDLIREVELSNGRRFRTVTAMVNAPSLGGRKTEQRRLAEVLMDGDVRLLRINLGGNEYEAKAMDTEPYLYLLRQGDVELPLELTTIMVYERLHANPSRFRNKLKYFVRDCPTAERLAAEAKFTNTSILRILNRYVECKGNVSGEVSQRDQPSVVRYDHFARLSYLNIRTAGFDDLQFSAGIGYRLEASSLNRYTWLSVLTGADYVYQTFRYREEPGVVQQSIIKANLSLGVSPVQGARFGLQLLGGLSSYNSLNSSLRSFFNNNYFLVSSGVRLRSRNWRVELSYETMPNAQADRPSNLLLVGVEYRLPIR